MSPAVSDPVSSEIELVETLKGHVTAVTSLAFSPSALLLVSGCCKGWMNVWALQVILVALLSLFTCRLVTFFKHLPEPDRRVCWQLCYPDIAYQKLLES